MLLFILLIVLVREIESRLGEILKLFYKKMTKTFAKKKEAKDQLLSAPMAWVGIIRRASTREELKSSRDKNARHGP